MKTGSRKSITLAGKYWPASEQSDEPLKLSQDQQQQKLPTNFIQIYSQSPITGAHGWLFICLLTAIAGALFTNAQYSQSNCDLSRFTKCQQDILRDMQTVSLNSASIQYPISGPPYSPKQQHQQQQQQLLVNPSICRQFRSNLDCLLTTTPACYDQGIQTAQNTDIILRAKRFIEQNNCNEPDTTWQNNICFRSPEIRVCEERYGFTTYSSTSLAANASACLTYQAFKYCVENHLRLDCKVREIDMANEYLIDRASDLTWRCPINTTATGANYASQYQLNNYPPNSGHSPSLSNYNNHGAYDQRHIPTYVGSSGGSGNLFGSPARDHSWERFRNPADEISRYGISRYPGSGQVFDRLVDGNNFDGESSDCSNKAAPYTRECEDTLVDQQRFARDSRDGIELQRRICCSFFQYRDCISRVVLDRCADSSVLAVEALMGTKRREMTITCRGFNRDICSGTLAETVLNLPIVLTVAILTSFITFKQSMLATIQL